jgi:hypothetical protein
MKHNSASIPRELKATPQWLGYKGTKAPRACFGNFHLASYANSENHSEYETALSAVVNNDLEGLGLAVTEFDPYVIVDLDACRDPESGTLTSFAREIVDSLDTYTEVSNSGKGLHIVCRTFADGNYKANDHERSAGHAIEFFSTAGYVILTGGVIEGRARIQNVPRRTISDLVDRLNMARKQVKTYDRTQPPDLVVVEKTFEVMEQLGSFARLILNNDEDPTLADRFPRDKDGALDRSKAVFLATINMREAGLTTPQAYSLLLESTWVLSYLDEKSDGWLWRYVVEPAYKAQDGETPREDLPGTKDAEFITQADLVASLRPVDWLIEGVLEANAVGVLAGRHSTYKSTIAIDWVLSVAAGLPWLAKGSRQGSAVVIAGEGSRGLARRAHAWGIEHDMIGDTLADLPVLWSKSAVQIMDPDRMGRAVATIKEMLQERFDTSEPDLVVVDTLNKNFAGGDENSASDISLFFERLSRSFPQSCVLVVHHFGKDKNKGTRGSSAIDAALDFLYHAEVNGGDITLQAQKMKDADKPQIMYLSPKVLELDIEGGDEVTTGVTIAREFVAGSVAQSVGVMKNSLQIIATQALVILGDLGRATRKDWVAAMYADGIAADEWDTENPRSWKIQLGKLVDKMLKNGLVVTEEDDYGTEEFKVLMADRNQ